MNNKKIYITAILAITAANSSFAQIRTVNSDAVGIATNSSAFIDASSNTSINGNPNLGKGLIFPRTDLSTFTTFGGAPFGILNNYPTFYDGMIVYNTKDGGVAGVGATDGTLKPGFWFYENKSSTVNGGTWKQVSSSTTNLLTIAGSTLTSTVNGVTSAVTLPAASNGVDNPANNGLIKDGTTVQLGGELLKQTIITTNDANRLFIRGNSTNAINFDDNTFSVDAQNDRIGIGTNAPTKRLDIRGVARADKFTVGSEFEASAFNVTNRNANEPIATFTGINGSAVDRKVTITNEGNVGIGTDNPTQKLDVDGNVRFRSVPESSSVGSTDRVMILDSDGIAKKVAINDLNKIGDVKYGFQQTDHDGWFFLNGRSINSLPSTSQANARRIFSTNNLPDSRQRVLKMKGTLASTDGSNSTSVRLSRANLPKITLSGTTSNNGNHSHSLNQNATGLLARGTSSRVALDRQGLSSSYGHTSTVPVGNLFNGTNASGDHNHTISVELNNAASQSALSIDTENSYLSVNVFVYLGQ
ncbi:hypothetical protein [Chryseobacterium sp. RU33C]|uniref:hypothetical protein n=1 Tax=Chryseobacterium sp. RU33C TaxID=1907398 RepID=UPI000954B3EE|nr:hypothetical protein [Chryseobacterium sp. RU33C]SIR65443.1 hypothetical protein SAMN05880573_1321 [Chryseobacterium sp. RU33C]